MPLLPVLQCHAVGIDLNLHRLFHVHPIPAGHGKRQWNTALPGPVKHPAVARFQAVVTQAQAAQAVPFKRISAGQKKNKPWRQRSVQFVQREVQRLQVGVVAAAVRQFDIQVAGFLAKRKVLGTVQRQREDAGIVGKNTGGAVALVHIQINHRDLQRLTRHARPCFLEPRPFGLHQPGSHRRIVEHTKTAAPVGVGMVRAACQVGGQARGLQSLPSVCALPGRKTQGHARSSHRGAHRAPGAFCHGQAPGETDVALCRWRQCAATHGADIRRRMHQRQFAVSGGWRLHQLNSGPFDSQPIAQARVFGHGEAVPLGQGQHKVVSVKSVHRMYDRQKPSEPKVELSRESIKNRRSGNRCLA